MTAKMTEQEAEARRVTILEAARWCFLNFGFAKTSLDDIAKRALISRSLLYRTFKDKEAIFVAVFTHWLLGRLPAAQAAAAAQGDAYERLLTVCRLVVLEPWTDMVGAPMASEFYDICEQVDPAISAQHRQITMECVTTIIGDAGSGEVFLFALDGLLADDPSPALLEQRVAILARRFTLPSIVP